MGACDAGRGLVERATDADGSPTIDTLLARLEALTARLDELADEIARLKAAPVDAAPRTVVGAKAKVGRRGMLRTVLEATAAAAVLTVAKEAATVHAETRTTLVSGGAS